MPIERWGAEDWLKEIVREYVRIEKEQAESEDTEKITPVNRRSQILRAFETGNCRLDTVMLLAESVGCQFQLVCKEVQVVEF
ncbi:hypothetical protein [Nodosilinea sp. P-1105]|uniref:hypothetical protein n=1 Tax=Nodosilinea sp. P-1105 TaxID=2546229 RepID=UPI00146ABF9E|nr:hypothetical protein [Nodosilinea sp. P-1105]NMF85056.1 hypothetical protein [Nodosilinea sp. P-1105]